MKLAQKSTWAQRLSAKKPTDVQIGCTDKNCMKEVLLLKGGNKLLNSQTDKYKVILTKYCIKISQSSLFWSLKD